jgi:hypothetical protein
MLGAGGPRQANTLDQVHHHGAVTGQPAQDRLAGGIAEGPKQRGRGCKLNPGEFRINMNLPGLERDDGV